MTRPFDQFVVFAGMRTGSNFLEANLNALDGATCHGEAFNPHFIGYPDRDAILGLSRAARDADPARLLHRMRDRTDGLGGFRYFHDHDPRVFDLVMDDPRCAKIVLTRNPLDSYVSWKIAQATDQWKLTDPRRRKAALATFDAAEFEAHLSTQQNFRQRIQIALQRRGQTAFHLAYEDLQDLEVLNGLLAFLGITARLQALDGTLKRQNPAPVAEKVANPEAMRAALARLDGFDLDRPPRAGPRRGPAVPGYVAAPRAPLLYMPLRSGPEHRVRRWLAALDGVGEEALHTGFTQKTLRQWKRRHAGHRSFTVLRHPVARVNAAFCERILSTGPGSFALIRETLRSAHGLPIPEAAPGPGWTPADHRAALLAFLEFLKFNLAGQTALRVDPAWATQASLIEGMGGFALPDMVVREEEMALWLPRLAEAAGVPCPPVPPPAEINAPLAAIYDAALEAKVAEVYQRDYMMFGFGPWRGETG